MTSEEERLMSPCPGEHATGQDRRPPNVYISHSHGHEKPVGRAGQNRKDLWGRNRFTFGSPSRTCASVLGNPACKHIHDALVAQITGSVCRFLAKMRGSVALQCPAWSRFVSRGGPLTPPISFGPTRASSATHKFCRPMRVPGLRRRCTSAGGTGSREQIGTMVRVRKLPFLISGPSLMSHARCMSSVRPTMLRCRGDNLEGDASRGKLIRSGIGQTT